MTNDFRSTTRRQLEELRTLYEIRPHFRDVVVEGRDDAALLRWYLAQCSMRNVRVYAVDDRVEIPSEAVKKVGQDIGARGRVIALAHEFDRWSTRQPTLTCIVDGDFKLFEPMPDSSSLLTTDYAAMEIYSLGDRPLSKFLSICARTDLSASLILDTLNPVWTALYVIRFILHRHAGGHSLVKKFAEKSLATNGDVTLDARELLRASISGAGKEEVGRLFDLYMEHLERVPPNTLHGIRGHDVAPLLIRLLGLQNELAIPSVVEHLLRQSIDPLDLDENQLFIDLRNRLTNPFNV
ncbi:MULTISPECIES: hypothetical protein [unclassified Mycobacterium]|uniref:hypothetical protein n=1 Tax=unclassified Mycobacterium TaxID=2642494 RepID=UPI0011174C41|nr:MULTISPECIES: hypothetical protein [unclassified Mycobacterium]